MTLLLLARLAIGATTDGGAQSLEALLMELALAPKPTSHVESSTDEDLDGHGRTTATRVTVKRVTYLSDGGSTDEILKATEDGKDVTAEQRAAAEDKERKADKAREKEKNEASEADVRLRFVNPFSEQPRYRFKAAGGDPAHLQIHFEPAGQSTPELMIGEATVDTTRGQVAHIHGQPSKLPRFVDQIDADLEYGSTDAGQWRLLRLVIKGSGGFLFIHKRQRTTISFSEYR